MKFLYTLVLCSIWGFSFSQSCSVNPPVGLKTSNITSCSIKLSWKKIPQALAYQVRYKLSNSSIWSPKITIQNDTFFVFTGLLAMKKYEFSVRSICPGNTFSAFATKSAATLACSLPIDQNAVALTNTSIKITWTNVCPATSAYVRIKTLHGSWNSIAAPSSGPAVITGLKHDSTYLYQLSTCIDTTNNWTAVDTFSFITPPNIILIILDDARYDFYSCNGAPPFFQTPSIDRIATEGVNFKNYFSTCSICAPSRACMASGLYPLKNGAISNEGNINFDIPTVDAMLHDNGYYTALIGKNHGTFLYDKGTYDFWMTSKNTDIDSLKQFQYYNGSLFVPGFITDIITDTARALIERVDKPLFMWLGYSITHNPLVSEPQYEGIYDNEDMPFSIDTLKYTKNYPSFLDQFPPSRKMGGQEMVDQYENSYEAIASMEENMSNLFTTLETTGKLDNTLLIFVSDNGHLYGEHGLYMKRLAYEASLRIPLFARYPAWFGENSVVTNQVALNIDIAPTILEAAGIDNSYEMDGISLHQLYNGSATRTEMYYQYIYSTEAGFGDVPFIRGIRDLKFKYLYYGCTNQTTEEFFDMVNDPGELVNLINTTSYQSLIQKYRDKLAAAKIANEDTIEETTLNCFLKHPVITKLGDIGGNDFLKVYPNPSKGNFTIVSESEDLFRIAITSSLGQLIYSKEKNERYCEVSLEELPDGVYYLQYSDPSRMETVKLLIQ
jgi:N-acetylglucosamine-6-sulfatase